MFSVVFSLLQVLLLKLSHLLDRNETPAASEAFCREQWCRGSSFNQSSTSVLGLLAQPLLIRSIALYTRAAFVELVYRSQFLHRRGVREIGAMEAAGYGYEVKPLHGLAKD